MKEGKEYAKPACRTVFLSFILGMTVRIFFWFSFQILKGHNLIRNSVHLISYDDFFRLLPCAQSHPIWSSQYDLAVKRNRKRVSEGWDEEIGLNSGIARFRLGIFIPTAGEMHDFRRLATAVSSFCIFSRAKRHKIKIFRIFSHTDRANSCRTLEIRPL